MIEYRKVLSALIEDCVRDFSKEKRIAARQLLSVEPNDEGQFLVHFSELESDLIHEANNFASFSDNEKGCLLQVLRFFRKLPGDASQDASIGKFQSRQQSLSYECIPDDVQSYASRFTSLILGPVASSLFSGHHGPGSSAEGNFGLDKSSVPRDAQLTELWSELGIDPLSRVRIEDFTPRTRISTVPKDWRGRRVIGMEPAWRMFTQLGLKSLLELRSQAYIPYYRQDLQRQMLNRSFEYRLCTVDLSDASDHISVDAAKAILPAHWFDLLSQARTPTYSLPDGTVWRTESFALMGNGFCFPCLSVIVTALAFATASLMLGLKPSYHTMRLLKCRYGVQSYGDDLVFPTDWFGELNSVFCRTGLVINYDKTGLGSFRETCGWYQFGDTCPFRCYYLKYTNWDTAEACLGLIALQNTLYKHGYPKTARCLERTAPEWVPRSSILSDKTHGKVLYTEDGSGPLGYSRSKAYAFQRGLKTSQQARNVALSDVTGWVAASTGGIPDRETYGPISVDVGRISCL